MKKKDIFDEQKTKIWQPLTLERKISEKRENGREKKLKITLFLGFRDRDGNKDNGGILGLNFS